MQAGGAQRQLARVWLSKSQPVLPSLHRGDSVETSPVPSPANDNCHRPTHGSNQRPPGHGEQCGMSLGEPNTLSVANTTQDLLQLRGLKVGTLGGRTARQSARHG